MIFAAKNEDGIPTWKLALDGEKTVTRRVKPIAVGKEFAICPGRGKYAVCRAKVISCIKSFHHYEFYGWETGDTQDYKDSEAKLEGFNSWDGFLNFLHKKGILFDDTYRIEFKVIREGLNR